MAVVIEIDTQSIHSMTLDLNELQIQDKETEKETVTVTETETATATAPATATATATETETETETYKDDDIPYLPQELIELIASFCNDKDTLFKLLMFFPYLFKQVNKYLILKHKYDFYNIYTNTIPTFLYDVVYKNPITTYSFNVLNYFKLIIPFYYYDVWFGFIMDEQHGSTFHKKNIGKHITKYILSCYSNKQLKQISYKILSYVLKYDLCDKKIDNIIFNRLSYSFKNTSKLKLSLLTNTEKEILLSNIKKYKIDHNSIIVSALRIYSTKLLDILADNDILNRIYLYLDYDDLNVLIADNVNNYLFLMILKYYLNLITLDSTYSSIILHILKYAIKHKYNTIINLICNIELSKKIIPNIIINSSYYDDNQEYKYNNLTYLLSHCKDINLSSLSWWYFHELLPLNEIHNKVNKHILLFQQYKLNDIKLDNISNELLLTIYNYFHYYYKLNKLHITSGKEYPEYNILDFKDSSGSGSSGGSGSGSSGGSGSGSSGGSSGSSNLSMCKNNLNQIINDYINYRDLVEKCNFIRNIVNTKYMTPTKHDTIHTKKEIKKIQYKIIYFMHIYKLILKYKLYNSIHLKNVIHNSSIVVLKVINNDKNFKYISKDNFITFANIIKQIHAFCIENNCCQV